MLIYFTLYISEFSVQRTLYNQPAETYVQNHKIRWSDEGRDFNGIPFIILGTKVLDCQHGKDRKASAKMKAKETKAEKR